MIIFTIITNSVQIQYQLPISILRHSLSAEFNANWEKYLTVFAI